MVSLVFYRYVDIDSFSCILVKTNFYNNISPLAPYLSVNLFCRYDQHACGFKKCALKPNNKSFTNLVLSSNVVLLLFASSSDMSTLVGGGSK